MNRKTLSPRQLQVMEILWDASEGKTASAIVKSNSDLQINTVQAALRSLVAKKYIEVGDIVSTMTKDKEIISAAVLHDTIEDCAGVSRELLAEEFSERVAGIVAQESEDKSKTWMERKSATIEHIRTAPKEVQMVGLADKLSNMRDIDRDYPVYGEELWNRFRMKDKGIIGWYYIGIRDALKESFEGVEAYEEYTRLVNKIFEQE